jgi:excisionase family DNA binding protein
MAQNTSVLDSTGTRAQTPSIPLRLLVTVEEAAVALGLGRTYTYGLVMCKQIASVKVGRKRRIPLFALEEFVTRQVAMQTLQKGA